MSGLVRIVQRAIAAAALAVLVAACTSGVQRHESDDGTYAYSGQTFGKVSVTISDAVKNDPEKAARAGQLRLEESIRVSLKFRQLYDEDSEASVHVVVDNLRVRSSFNSFMWGYLAGGDFLGGTVTLNDASGRVLKRFIVSARYDGGGPAWSLGGTAGPVGAGLAGRDTERLGRLASQFGDLTAEAIVGKKEE
jgi:hypothetical protein